MSLSPDERSGTDAEAVLKMREFRDSEGQLWRAWPVTPEHARPGEIVVIRWASCKSSAARRALAGLRLYSSAARIRGSIAEAESEINASKDASASSTRPCITSAS